MQNETNKRVVCDITSPTLSIYIYTLVFGAQNPQTEGGRLGSCSSLCVCACFGFLESAQKDSLHACFKHFHIPYFKNVWICKEMRHKMPSCCTEKPILGVCALSFHITYVSIADI